MRAADADPGPSALLDVTPDVLAALGLPPRALARWLDDVEAFCRAHGGERYYGELLALVAAARRTAGQAPGGRREVR